ncbi:hypothetical protein SCHPADRAFT_118870 [Schizopora paradoxa]|uniref:Uncharacterized protein n=1 Tax=Schizopora paradoxa TaxID=27342 RepID=A0A0H2S2C9_9AGAM|nr:hypothetical protein SCHPADRAFT_118870 [Schizopora paradoxa]
MKFYFPTYHLMRLSSSSSLLVHHWKLLPSSLLPLPLSTSTPFLSARPRRRRRLPLVHCHPPTSAMGRRETRRPRNICVCHSYLVISGLGRRKTLRKHELAPSVSFLNFIPLFRKNLRFVGDPIECGPPRKTKCATGVLGYDEMFRCGKEGMDGSKDNDVAMIHLNGEFETKTPAIFHLSNYYNRSDDTPRCDDGRLPHSTLAHLIACRPLLATPPFISPSSFDTYVTPSCNRNGRIENWRLLSIHQISSPDAAQIIVSRRDDFTTFASNISTSSFPLLRSSPSNLRD